MRSLITGAAGFVGRHLVRYLSEHDHSVAGLVLPEEASRGLGSLPEFMEIFEGDILEGESLRRIVADWKPSAIYHLAAFSNPEGSWAQARRTLETNILGTHNLLEAAVACGHKPRVLLVGSSQQYGYVAEEDQPIREEQLQKPLSPYGVSKASQEILGQRFHLSGLIPVLLTRSFNHTGPGQAASYVCSSFARQIAEIESGSREPKIKVGNLSARRDFSDVRDVVRAYTLLMEKGQPGETYLICSGQAVAIETVLTTLIDLAGVDVNIEYDPARMRPSDTPILYAAFDKIQRDTGWAPSIPLRQSLQDVLDDWLAKVDNQ